MPTLRVRILVGFEEQPSDFLEVHLNQQQIQDLAHEAGTFADIMASLQKIGKVFGFA